jgi:dihydroorotate dehydrogenase
MMNLTTTYLGLELRSPLVVGAAAPLSEDLDNIKRLEDAGAAAIVLHSLFEEQIERETLDFHHHSRYGTDSFAEALTYFPEPDIFHVGPDLYSDYDGTNAGCQSCAKCTRSSNGNCWGEVLSIASWVWRNCSAMCREFAIIRCGRRLSTSCPVNWQWGGICLLCSIAPGNQSD